MNEQNDTERLRNLLARIHRDGGHYVEQNGIEAACEDADEIVVKLYAGECELRDKLEQSEKSAAAMREALGTILEHGDALSRRGRPDLCALRGLAWKAKTTDAGKDYVPRADLERVERERDRMRDCLELLDRLGGLGLDKHQWIREALLKEAK